MPNISRGFGSQGEYVPGPGLPDSSAFTNLHESDDNQIDSNVGVSKRYTILFRYLRHQAYYFSQLPIVAEMTYFVVQAPRSRRLARTAR